ncbi:MAG: OsmC family protein [Planctomycetaceae bacterium]|nr:OsmC family protein [Planctomycetaceae bacterium]
MITLRIEANWEKNKSATYVRAGQHQIVVDEPLALGGEDLGPNPMHYLFAGMAGCFIGTGKALARQMDLSINSIRCRVEGDLSPESRSGDDPTARPGCVEIRMIVTVDSDEPEEKIAKWLEIVERRCPVRDNVANATPVKMVRR